MVGGCDARAPLREGALHALQRYKADWVIVQKYADKLFGVNDRGQRVGEDHPGAVLTNHEVDLLLELRGEGYSYGWLSVKFEVSKSCVAKICRGEHRAQSAVVYRRARGL